MSKDVTSYKMRPIDIIGRRVYIHESRSVVEFLAMRTSKAAYGS